ncbi:MAG: hypothetical protein U9O87_02605 [Verrucomicrobiota bacterium]|nr:hypothetical protein [Verrucomicrobiota bacterium]
MFFLSFFAIFFSHGGEEKSKFISTEFGPFYEKVICKENDNFLFALRPFYSSFSIPSKGYSGQDFLWPLAVTRERLTKQHKRFLFFFNTTKQYPDAHDTEQLWFLPFYFQGRSLSDCQYSAIFPFGGTIYGFIGYDYVKFILFPFYGSTSKGEVKSQSYLWPFISFTKGPNIEKKRFFPFWGKSIKKNVSEKTFYLWPFLHTAHSLSNDYHGGGFFFFPFFGIGSYNNNETHKTEKNLTFLWPFFSFKKSFYKAIEKNVEKKEIYSNIHCPWPFYQKKTDNEAKEKKLYFWPFYGYKKRENYRKDFILWPFFQKTTVTDNSKLTKNTYLLPFYQSFVKKSEDKIKSQYKIYWPFCRNMENDKFKRTDILALYPLRSEEVNRNYAPFWTLYSSCKSKDGNKKRTSFLWNLIVFEKNKSKQESSFELLGGLLRFEEKAEKTSLKLLWSNKLKTKNE